MNPKKLILGVDPGTTKTAYAVYDSDTKKILEFGRIANAEFLDKVGSRHFPTQYGCGHMAIEMMASMGMAVGQSTFETAVWIGRFVQAWLHVSPMHSYEFVYRADEKLHLCGNPRAKDPNIRQAIMDRYGSTRELAIGKKQSPGPLFGISDDVWSALAIAITASELALEHRAGHGGATL